MNTLRLLLCASPAPDQPVPWAVYDGSGACLDQGRDPASAWPRADRTEIVVGAHLVRLASVALPPVSPARVNAAVAFALEDQLAHGGDAAVLTASPQRADGRVVVAIVARPVLAAIRANAAMFGALALAVPEAALASADPGWCWCVPDDTAAGEGFVRVADGSAFPTSARNSDDLPPELAVALAQAERSHASPAQVRVDATVSDALLLRWTKETAVAFVRGTPWRWHAAPSTAYSQAINLLQGEFATAPPPRSGDRVRLFVPALWIAGAALALHVLATIGEWAYWRIDTWRAGRALTNLAVTAGASLADVETPAAAKAALARIYAEQRHAHGMPAPNDALPLLARAAPALPGLPPGAIKSATYADGHWTLDLQKVDAQAVRDFEVRLRTVGTPAVVATTPTGARLRLEGS